MFKEDILALLKNYQEEEQNRLAKIVQQQELLEKIQSVRGSYVVDILNSIIELLPLIRDDGNEEYAIHHFYFDEEERTLKFCTKYSPEDE